MAFERNSILTQEQMHTELLVSFDVLKRFISNKSSSSPNACPLLCNSNTMIVEYTIFDSAQGNEAVRASF